MMILIACTAGGISGLMFYLLWKLTEDEAFGMRFARLAGHRSLGDAGLDESDAMERITGAQSLALIIGIMAGAVLVVALLYTALSG